MSKKTLSLLIATTISVIVFLNSAFIVEERNQAMVVQFGQPIKVIEDAGLNFKLPFIQNVIFFDKRILDLSIDEKEVIASDQKRIIINAFTKYRITDPLKYYTTVRNSYGVKNKLNTILDSSLRQVVGEVPLKELLTEKRSTIMSQIQEKVSKESQIFGIEITDVRIMRGDLPKENSQAIFRRMQTEREREAKEIRAEGAEQSQTIRAQASKEKVIILSEANKKSEILKGQGDASATRIFANAFSTDPNFFAFYRSMQSYKNSLTNGKTTLVLSPDSEFFKFFDKINSRPYRSYQKKSSASATKLKRKK